MTREKLAGVLPRAALDTGAALERIRPVCEGVRDRGAAAVREYTARFDGVDLPTSRVPAQALTDALAGLDEGLRAALEEMVRRVRPVHQAQRPADHVTRLGDGARVTERYVPVSRAGVYVPAGLVPLPSSVVMNVIPAQVAGVGQITVASPPQPGHGGLPAPAILAACALLGIEEVHAVGGAQAVAMFAYGTADCAPVDVITGPGNAYVTAAKRLVAGTVGVDAEAGPTEIAIIADHTADPRFLAADLVAQAEHGPLAACLLITTDPGLADRTEAELGPQVASARHRDTVRAALEGQSACVLVDDTDAALAVSDVWAPEHLEIQAEDAARLAARVRNAGAVFVGPYAPVSLGDYLAGSNHVLPTGGTARHTAGLSVLAFMRGIHVVEYTAAALAEAAPYIDALGAAEDLAAHVAAVRIRVPEGQQAPADAGRQRAPAPPIRPDLAGRSPYGAPQLDVPVRLNTNENPFPPPPALVRAITEAVAEAAGSLNRYPDRDAMGLRAELAAYLGHELTARQVWAANGSNEIIQQLLQVFGGHGRSALGFEPSYAMHPLISRATGTRWISGARDEDFGLDPDAAVRAVREHQPDLVFLTSPNNPTGTGLPLAVIEAVCAAAPGMVVVDEAYAEFAREGTGTALALLERGRAQSGGGREARGREEQSGGAGKTEPRYPRLVVTRTMSKAFALAGARVGYLAADPGVVDALLLVRLPYHLSAQTQATARAALAHAGTLLATVADLRAERDSLVDWLRGRGLTAADSDANFVLFGTFGDSHAVWQGLLGHGVLVREVGPPGWLRVSIGTPAEMAAFRAALTDVLDTQEGAGQ
jgi:histidinol dehydrogenase